MIEYVEEFEIAGKTYGIEATPGGRYDVWAGGCQIGGVKGFDNKERAREYIFGYVDGWIASALKTARMNVSFLEGEQKKLGNDVFNLGRFRKD